jgi:hypothetical protein
VPSGWPLCAGRWLSSICGHLEEIASFCQANIAEAISLAKELNDMNALANALPWAAGVAYNERNPCGGSSGQRQFEGPPDHGHLAPGPLTQAVAGGRFGRDRPLAVVPR